MLYWIDPWALVAQWAAAAAYSLVALVAWRWGMWPTLLVALGSASLERWGSLPPGSEAHVRIAAAAAAAALTVLSGRRARAAERRRLEQESVLAAERIAAAVVDKVVARLKSEVARLKSEGTVLVMLKEAEAARRGRGLFGPYVDH